VAVVVRLGGVLLDESVGKGSAPIGIWPIAFAPMLIESPP
jgi:hypothetical protein